MRRFRVYSIIVHCAGWLLFMAFPLVFINAGQNGNEFALLNSSSYWLFCLTYIFLFYINAYLLIPRLLLKKRYPWYGLAVISLMIGVYFIQPYDHLLRGTEKNTNFQTMPGPPPMEGNLSGHRLPPSPGFHEDERHNGPGGPPHQPGNRPPNIPLGSASQFGPQPPHSPFRPNRLDSTSLFIFIMIMALSAAVKTIQQWQMTEQRAARAEADKTSAELSFLKAQINPHFLFNTLNNIYTLTVMKDDHAPDSIMKLSNIMRYVTDDAAEDFVPLQSEIDCIYDYIELQKLRLGEKTSVDLHISGEAESKKIAPLILMTFIENIFKYGISKHKPSDIIIRIDVNKNDITFFCQNQIFPVKNNNERTGIGLKNTRQRLMHLYPGKYLLDIDTDNQLYTVKLILEN